MESLFELFTAHGLSTINTGLLIIIAWFIRRMIAAYDTQTTAVNNLLADHEKRIIYVEARVKHERSSDVRIDTRVPT